jgi:hypothetical protein
MGNVMGAKMGRKKGLKNSEYKGVISFYLAKNKSGREYCSMKCSGIAHRLKKKICGFCSIEFQPRWGRQQYCSRMCAGKVNGECSAKKSRGVRRIPERYCKFCKKSLLCGQRKYCSYNCAVSDPERKRKIAESLRVKGIIPPSRKGIPGANKGIIGWRHSGSFKKREGHCNWKGLTSEEKVENHWQREMFRNHEF